MPNNMSQLLGLARSGVVARLFDLDVVSNNLANVNTFGYKSTRVNFQELLTNATEQGTLPRGTQMLLQQGALRTTGNPLDVAIQGEGFFAVTLPDGSTGYTRDGAFHLNADGKLVSGTGNVLLPEITVPNDTLEISIDAQGRVSGRTAGSPDTSTVFGQITIHRFINPSGMLAVGANVLRPSEASGAPISNIPGSTGLGLLKQGFIERSNVQIVNELVNLIVAQRAYEVNSRAIQASDQMLSTATNLSR